MSYEIDPLHNPDPKCACDFCKDNRQARFGGEIDRTVIRNIVESHKSNNLFQRGEFVLSSGLNSALKIDCDALTNEDIETIAWMINGNLWLDFGAVEGIPRGGSRLAAAMRQYARPYKTDRVLIVDDVWTTGQSMEKKREEWAIYRETIGAVIFARSPVANWVLPLLSLWS